jgi:lauroyl/myristoyl acyltransferase
MADRLVAVFFSLLFKAIHLLPLAWFEPVAGVLAWVLRLFSPKDVRRLRENVQRIYKLPPGSHFSAMFEKQVFHHHIVCALETLRMVTDPEVGQVEGFHELEGILKQVEDAQKGHLLLTAHLGSWELCAYFGQKAASRPLVVLAKPPKRPFLLRPLARFREQLGAKVLWTDQKTLLREMLGTLKRGEGLGFVMDQKPDSRRGPLVTFLGQPTIFVGGPASMAVRTQCAAVSIFCVREGPFRYRILSSLALKPDHGETDEHALTQVFAQSIETAIRAYPEQWTWNYRRWQ